jgi:hypothetical protein
MRPTPHRMSAIISGPRNAKGGNTVRLALVVSESD